MNFNTKNGDLRIRWVLLIGLIALWALCTVVHPIFVIGAAAEGSSDLGEYLPVFDWWMQFLPK